MSRKAQLIPVEGTENVNYHPDCWKAVFGSARFDIFSNEGGGISGGWVSIQGELIRRGGDYNARLYYDLGAGFKENQYFEIPASGRGVIDELICFPEGVQRLKFLPMGTAGEFELGSLTAIEVGALERRWRMIRRIVMTMLQHSRQKRSVINLTFFRMLTDLRGAYKTAGKLRAHGAAPQYRDWVSQFDELTPADLIEINNHISRFADFPVFQILIVLDGAEVGGLDKTLRSLNTQLYRHFSYSLLNMSGKNSEVASEQLGIADQRICVEKPHLAAWLDRFNGLLADNRGDWVLVVRAGDVLAPHALYWFACEAIAKPEAVVLYSDDDALDAKNERCLPKFKPDWSLAHLRATNYVGEAVALRGNEVAKAGGLQPDCFLHGSYDLLLRVVDVAGGGGVGKVSHIPAVLLHRGGRSLSMSVGAKCVDWNATQWNIEKVREHLARNGVPAEVTETLPDGWRVRYQLPEVPPLVSIIVPTRDALELIRQCVGSLLERTTYPRFEILVVDNQTATPDALAYLGQIAGHKSVRLLRYDLPFNYSAMNNMAVREARGEVLCLLNNDTEVISSDWLEEMVGQLLQTKVGVVGAKLYFPNGQIQHGGDLLGVGGVANHAHAFLQRDDPGYCNRAKVVQEFSAVTAACLVTRKDVYQELGGLDEKNLTVAFNDVDYCLRAREAGYRVVWTPHAELYHHESVTRGKDQGAQERRRAKGEVKYMRRRWKRVLQQDPFYNPNLSYERPDFSLSHAPLVKRPWRR